MRSHLRSYDLAVTFYRATRHKRLIGGLRNQFLRASSSIALNLNEGSSRISGKERKRFFSIAFGSIRECQSVMELESQAFTVKERDLLDHLAASVYKLIHNSP